MKIRNLIVLVFAGILFLSLVSANGYYYQNTYSEGYANHITYSNELSNNDNVIFVIKYPDSYTTSDSLNMDRYPISDYRNGYSYRATPDYYSNNQRTQYSQNDFRRSNDDVRPETYYVYSNYMKTYEEHQCYNQAPSDKLIYIKCP